MFMMESPVCGSEYSIHKVLAEIVESARDNAERFYRATHEPVNY